MMYASKDTSPYPATRALAILTSLFVLTGAAGAAEPTDEAFAIRGALPWHNFLSGPTAWNEADYKQYLDRLKALRLNFIGFHCYTGGAEQLEQRISDLLAAIEKARPQTESAGQRDNHDWLTANLKFTLLLDEVSRKIEPAYQLKNDWLTGKLDADQLKSQAQAARADLDAAPIETLFATYTSRVRSRGELGVLSSLNQRLWRQYTELRDFLNQRKPDN